MRTTPEECREIGRRIAAQLNGAEGPSVLVLPLKGVSMIDAPGEPFHDPRADAELFDSLRESVDDGIEVVEADRHINDPEFATLVVDQTLRLLGTSLETGRS
jgi:uncharacterized protein (UPF0261 family)